MEHFTGNRRIILHTHLPDHLNDYDAESETGNGIHGAVTFGKCMEQGSILIGSIGCRGKDRCARVQQGRYNENRQENKNSGLMIFRSRA